MSIQTSNIQQLYNMKEAISSGGKTYRLSYSLKKLFKIYFKQNKMKRDAHLEQSNKDTDSLSLECSENDANERLSANFIKSVEEKYDCSNEIMSVPVHFIRTDHGTFFWTATANIPADNDLNEPLCCCTTKQVAASQFQDRWAQA